MMTRVAGKGRISPTACYQDKCTGVVMLINSVNQVGVSGGIQEAESTSEGKEEGLTMSLAHVESSPVSSDTKINFKNIIDKADRFSDFISAAIAAKYQDESYAHRTVGEYRKAKKYPSGIDMRPVEFDPAKYYSTFDNPVCAHGTNLETVVKSILNTNMQLVPAIKQIKLQGDLPQTGESAGVTSFNRKFVSTVSLGCITSDYFDVKYYADKAAGSSNKSSTIESKMPVIVIGDGVERCPVQSTVANEMGYKRVNIRLLALKNASDIKFVTTLLGKLYDETGNGEIMNIRLCLYDELDEKKLTTGHAHYMKPDLPALWRDAFKVSYLINLLNG